jgi:hypothetical protein
MVGHSFGRAGRRHLLAAVVFALLVTPLVSVILDLDRARKGLIRENINSARYPGNYGGGRAKVKILRNRPSFGS